MKNLLKYILVFLYSTSAAQKNTVICGTIQSSQKFILHVYEPLNGYYNRAFLETSKGNSSMILNTDSFYKRIFIKQPSFIKIFITKLDGKLISQSEVLIFSGDSLHVNLKPDSTTAAMYTGSNAAAQKLYDEINLLPSLKYKPIRNLLNKIPLDKELFLIDIDKIVSSFTKRFDSLQKNGSCTKNYANLMRINFKAIMYNEAIKSLLPSFKEREDITRVERDSIINKLFNQQQRTTESYKSLPFAATYINNYYQYLNYKKKNLSSMNSIEKKDSVYYKRKKKYLIKSDFSSYLNIEDEATKQDLWALDILIAFNYLPGKYDESEIRQFNRLFPNNKWKIFLRRQFNNKNIVKKIAYKLATPVKFISNSAGIVNFESVLTKMPKGKAVFVDLWASWCAPCISAYSFNKPLDSFLLKNNIEKLYISLDKISDKEKWEKAIEKYALGGYHILVNDSLKTSLKTEIYHIGKNEGMAIPRYLLIGKNGKIVVDDVYSPTEFKLLKEQINSFLIP